MLGFIEYYGFQGQFENYALTVRFTTVRSRTHVTFGKAFRRKREKLFEIDNNYEFSMQDR